MSEESYLIKAGEELADFLADELDVDPEVDSPDPVAVLVTRFKLIQQHDPHPMPLASFYIGDQLLGIIADNTIAEVAAR